MSGEREPVEWQFRELRTPDPSKFLTVEGVGLTLLKTAGLRTLGCEMMFAGGGWS